MILRVLGSSGAEYQGHNPPAYLIDGRLLLDGGTIGTRLDNREQWKIKNVLLSHSHLDHIKGIPFLADNIVIKQKDHSISLYGRKETLAALRENLLNDRLWPDFTKISAAIEPVIKLRSIKIGSRFKVDSYSVLAVEVNHTVPAVGYTVSDRKGRTILYTGDTGPTDAIWKVRGPVHAMIVEVSFPNRMEELAIKTGHLTARLLRNELMKLVSDPAKIYITHPKPQYLKQIAKELRALKNRKIELLSDGRTYEI